MMVLDIESKGTEEGASTGKEKHEKKGKRERSVNLGTST